MGISKAMKSGRSLAKGFTKTNRANPSRNNKDGSSIIGKRSSKLPLGKRKGRFEWTLNDGLPYYTFIKEKEFSNDLLLHEGCNKLKRKGSLYYDGKNSTYLGRHPIRNNTRPQKFSKSHTYSNLFQEKFSKLFIDCEVDVNKNVIIEGCWHTNKHTLQKQMIPDVDNEFSGLPSYKTLKKLFPSVKNVLRKLNFKTLPKCNMNDIYYSQYNKKTYPGFHYDQYGLIRNKAECVTKSVEVAKRRWQRISKGSFTRNEIFPSLYTIGARNKRDFTYDDGEVASSRVVHMPEFHAELTSGPWTDRITDFIKETKVGPMFIGNSYLEFERLHKVLENSKSQFEGDWKRFDSTLYISIIICAVSILRCFYDLDDKEIDNHFIAIFDCVGIKDYYTPGGHVFRLIHGLPSGVKSTNLIGTIINLIAMDMCCGSTKSRNFDFIAGGDDFVIVQRKGKIKAESFIERFIARASKIGMKVKFLLKKDMYSANVEELPCFYKYVVKDETPTIPLSAMLERVFMPWNRKYSDVSDLYDFTFEVMPSLGMPRTHLMIYYLYISFLSHKVSTQPLSFSDAIKTHLRIYKSMMNRKENFSQFKSKTDYSIPLIDFSNLNDQVFVPRFKINFLSIFE